MLRGSSRSGSTIQTTLLLRNGCRIQDRSYTSFLNFLKKLKEPVSQQEIDKVSNTTSSSSSTTNNNQTVNNAQPPPNQHKPLKPVSEFKLDTSKLGFKWSKPQIGNLSHYEKPFNSTAVYALGLNTQGQLGLGDQMSEDKFTFLELLGEQSVQSIKSSLLHNAILTNHNDMFTWGGNAQFQVGHKDGTNTSVFPSQVEHTPHSVKKSAFPRNKVYGIGVGGWHTFALTHDEQGDTQVMTWGNNMYGQMGIGSIFNVQMPSVLPSLSVYDIKSVSSGGLFHSHFITDKGKVMSCGKADDGQLGISDLKYNHVTLPTIADKLYDLDMDRVVCGSFHSLGIDSRGKLYQWGSGAIDMSKKETLYYTPDSIRNAVPPTLNNHKVLAVSIPQPSDNTNYKYSKIIDIAAGDNISLALTESGVLYAWDTVANEPKRIEFPEFANNKIIKVTTSLTHTGVVLEPIDNNNNQKRQPANQVFIWPNRSFKLDKELGGNFFHTITEKPKLFTMPQDHNIIDLSLGVHYAIIVTEQIPNTQ